MPEEQVTIVLVHGMSQAWKIAPTMERDLSDAVLWGLGRQKYESARNLKVRLAFYGDLYRPANLGEYRNGDDRGDAGLYRNSGDNLRMESVELDILEELDESEGLDAFVGPARDRGVTATTARRLARIAERTGIDEVIVRTFAKEVSKYLSIESLYLDTVGCVSSLLDEDEASRYIVLGHSLGSIVALEALHLNGDDRCLGFITMGSPLGLGVVLRAMKTRGHRSIPRAVPRWTNVYDLDDFVCVAPRLNDLYSAATRPGIVDIETHGQDPSLKRLGAAHDFRTYLSSDAVSQALIGFLRNL